MILNLAGEKPLQMPTFPLLFKKNFHIHVSTKGIIFFSWQKKKGRTETGLGLSRGLREMKSAKLALFSSLRFRLCANKHRRIRKPGKNHAVSFIHIAKKKKINHWESRGTRLSRVSVWMTTECYTYPIKTLGFAGFLSLALPLCIYVPSLTLGNILCVWASTPSSHWYHYNCFLIAVTLINSRLKDKCWPSARSVCLRFSRHVAGKKKELSNMTIILTQIYNQSLAY